MKKTLATLHGILTLAMTHAQLSLTIYNDDFAVIREALPIRLQAGDNTITYDRATLALEPDSVILRDTATGEPLRVLEQSYRNDPVSIGRLLEIFEGRQIEFFQPEPQKPDRLITGKIIRSGYNPSNPSAYNTDMAIIETDGKIRFGLPGQPLFPDLGGGTILRPTLEWKIASSTPADIAAEVGYISSGLGWKASYNIVLPEKGDLAAFTGWITISNKTGRAFQNASLKLLAGEVQKVRQAYPVAMMAGAARAARFEDAAVEEKEFDDYHLYTIPRATDLRDQETKQIEFLRAGGVKIQTLYIYDALAGSVGYFRHLNRADLRTNSELGANDGPTTVLITREFKNSKDNQLGVPLPAGIVRFYRQDTDGSLQFVGEQEIEHTPKDETLRIVTGKAFDLVVERKRVNFRVDTSNKWTEESFEFSLRNRKSEPATIRVIEHAFRWNNWQITKSSQPHDKISSDEFRFLVELAPDEEKTLSYTIRYTW